MNNRLEAATTLDCSSSEQNTGIKRCHRWILKIADIEPWLVKELIPPCMTPSAPYYWTVTFVEPERTSITKRLLDWQRLGSRGTATLTFFDTKGAEIEHWTINIEEVACISPSRLSYDESELCTVTVSFKSSSVPFISNIDNKHD